MLQFVALTPIFQVTPCRRLPECTTSSIDIKLALLQERLEHLRCILPEDHPYIGLATFIHFVCLIGHVPLTLFAGDAMRDVGQAYRCLGLHHDALMFVQKTLEFRRRVLPKDHPEIGAE